MKTQTMKLHAQVMDILQSANNTLPTGKEVYKVATLKPTALAAIALSRSVSMLRTASITVGILFLVSMSFAQQSSTSAANVSDPSAASDASAGTNNLDNSGGDVSSVRSPRIQRPIAPPAKAAEVGDSDVPKNEGSGAPSDEQVERVTGGTYDVGIIPEAAYCPPGSERITIYMDDEDNKNADSISGWTGAITQPGGRNTQFVFCRVDGQKLHPAAQNYAVLKLADQCPPSSTSFERTFVNECKNNQNWHSGEISPNYQNSRSCLLADSFTFLNFCYFPRAASVYPPPFPDLGIGYGVFASSNFSGVLATGRLHTDDEDDLRFFGDSYDSNYYALGTGASDIISGDNNTDINVVKVMNSSVAQGHCMDKVLYYDGTFLTAKWDGANCYIKAVPAGVTPFIYNNAYYVTANKSTQCLAGTWDGANCFFMPKPLGGFLWHDAFYVPPGPGHSCLFGGTYDGANCLLKSAPWGTHAFEWQNKWYFTTLYTCKDGAYDGANCYVMKAPAFRLPFIYNRAFYYAE